MRSRIVVVRHLGRRAKVRPSRRPRIAATVPRKPDQRRRPQSALPVAAVERTQSGAINHPLEPWEKIAMRRVPSIVLAAAAAALVPASVMAQTSAQTLAPTSTQTLAQAQPPASPQAQPAPLPPGRPPPPAPRPHPAPLPPAPYKPVPITVPAPLNDPSFDAFRKQLAA